MVCTLPAHRFKAFHERYYHPSNARFWFYGNDPPEERLRILGVFLDEFDARPVDSTVHPQPLFSVRGLPLSCLLSRSVCGVVDKQGRGPSLGMPSCFGRCTLIGGVMHEASSWRCTAACQFKL